MIISKDEEKAFDKAQHLFMIKTSAEAGHRWNLPQHNKKTYMTNLQLIYSLKS